MGDRLSGQTETKPQTEACRRYRQGLARRLDRIEGDLKIMAAALSAILQDERKSPQEEERRC